MSVFPTLDQALAAIGTGAFFGVDELAARLVYLSGSGAPTLVVPSFIGQRYFDTSGTNWYTAYGTAAGEFKQDSN